MPVKNWSKADPKKTVVNEECWKCYELRLKGLSLRAIGKILGLNHQTVANRLELANRAIVLPGVEEYRKIEDERLDMMWKALIPRIEIGETRAIEQGIRLLERRAKLHGLDRPAEMNVTVHEIDERDRELAEMTREYMLKKHADDPSTA
jgi:transcriptional regulator with XRE-family HTH domain